MSVAVETLAREIDWSLPFEELAEGAVFATRGRTVTEADVTSFAALTGDWHPLHTDAVWAASGPFGQRVAHGLLVVSIAAGMVPFDPQRVLALRAVREAKFKRPVKLGDTIHVQGRISELRELTPQAGLVSFTWAVEDQRSRRVCQARVDVLWSRDDAPAAEPEWEPLPL
jgi:acyl dehydratase